MEWNATPEWLGQKVRQSHIDLALGIWRDMHAPREACARELHARFNEVIGQRHWKRSTKRRLAGVLRAVLSKAGVPGVAGLRLAPISQERDAAIGRYARLAATHPARQLLEDWSRRLEATTQNRSALSRRNVLQFLTARVLPVMGLRAESLPVNWREVARTRCVEVAPTLCATREKMRWYAFFCREILGLEPPAHRPKPVRRQEDDGHDAHWITNEDLEALHAEARKNPLDELMFMTLLTTGMRIGALARLRIDQVAEREVGTTVEKGGKTVHFQLHARVRELLAEHLRKSTTSSPFVFPGGVEGHVSTMTLRRRFRALCRAAHLSGPEFHPHALRHCFSHLLLQAGNSVQVVSKLLNHASTATTEKFYLRETSLEATQRARIPWFGKRPRVAPLPSFLVAEDRTAKLQKMLTQLETLM